MRRIIWGVVLTALPAVAACVQIAHAPPKPSAPYVQNRLRVGQEIRAYERKGHVIGVLANDQYRCRVQFVVKTTRPMPVVNTTWNDVVYERSELETIDREPVH